MEFFKGQFNYAWIHTFPQNPLAHHHCEMHNHREAAVASYFGSQAIQSKSEAAAAWLMTHLTKLTRLYHIIMCCVRNFLGRHTKVLTEKILFRR